MGKPRLLLPITYQFSVRYVLRTGLLEHLSEFTHPVVVVSWQDPGLYQELEQNGAEVHLLPESKYGSAYLRIRRQIDTWFERRLNTPSSAIDRRRMEVPRSPYLNTVKRLQRLKHRLVLALQDNERYMFEQERCFLQADTNLAEFVDLLDEIKPSAVFSVTPFHKYEDLLLRAAKMHGLPTSASFISFDNLTTRGWIPIIYDHYLVWNQYNLMELRRAYPEASEKPIDVVGAPQFDFYYDSNYIWEEVLWRQRLDLPMDRPVILFAGGPVNIVPHEPHILGQLDQAVAEGWLPYNPIILFRRHPIDELRRWQPILDEARHIVVDQPWQNHDVTKYANIDQYGIEKLTSTLAHSAVHINTSSTMTLDGAIFDRPQIGPAYDDRPGKLYDHTARDLYKREHFLPIVRSGGLAIAYSREELIDHVRDALLNPGRLKDERQRMVREIATFTDGRATERVVRALQKFIAHQLEHIA